MKRIFVLGFMPHLDLQTSYRAAVGSAHPEPILEAVRLLLFSNSVLSASESLRLDY